MNVILNRIIEKKKEEVKWLYRNRSNWAAKKDIPKIRGFKSAVCGNHGVKVIGEIKFASPSKGIIRDRIDPCDIGKIYEKSGVAAISVLTDEHFFHGNIQDLLRLKELVSLPLLRKDFIIDEIQVEESYYHGADAVLLISRILSKEKLWKLISITRELGLTPITEVHDEEDLDKALECRPMIIGINNRNLKTFHVDLKTTRDLAPMIPSGPLVISESGIHHGMDIQMLHKYGISAVLVGTALMKSENIESETRQLVRAGKLEWAKSA